jgi:hypothetical protein
MRHARLLREFLANARQRAMKVVITAGRDVSNLSNLGEHLGDTNTNK